jgi:Calx-beta domain
MAHAMGYRSFAAPRLVDADIPLNLSALVNASLAKAQGLGTIVDDDTQGTLVQFSESSYEVSESLTSVTITVTRSGDTSGTSTVDYFTKDEEATQQSDYEIASSTLAFAPGETTRTIQVLTNEDKYVEGQERVALFVTNPTGANLGSQSSTVLKINNNDSAESLANPLDDPQSFVHLHFMRDLQAVSRGVIVNSPGWQQQIADNQQKLAQDWLNRPSFKSVYDAMSNADYVNVLYANAGVVPPQAERDGLVTELDKATQTRAEALLEVASNAAFRHREQNSAFVPMQYLGYLRRDPDSGPDSDLSGYNFWLNKLSFQRRLPAG